VFLRERPQLRLPRFHQQLRVQYFQSAAFRAHPGDWLQSKKAGFDQMLCVNQKPMLRADGECSCVAQMARAKIRTREWPSPLLRARHLWVVRTLEMHRGRRPAGCLER
jgi:hypothetical protein